MEMKAAVYYGPGDIRIEEVERPVAGEKGMVLKVRACGICPLVDLAHYKMSFPHVDIPPHHQENVPEKPAKIILGHEFSGDVVEIGSAVTAVNIGDRIYGVTWNPCGKCEACRSGKPDECNFIDAAGRAIHGALAEYILFPNVTLPSVTEDKLIKLPEDMTYRDGALLEPLMLGIGIANKAKAGDVVVVFGQEVMGLGAVARLKEIGVSKIITVDVSKKRLLLSKEAGADLTVDSSRENVFKTIMEETSGKGADLVMEMSCRPENLQEAVCVVRPFGQIWLGSFYTVGSFFNPSWQAPRMVSMNITQKPGLSINTAWGTLGPWLPRLKKAVEIIKAGKVNADKCATHIYSLAEAREAFEIAIHDPDSVKVIIEP